MTGKEAYEMTSHYYIDALFHDRPWEALPQKEKVRWEEIAFEQEQKERKDAE